jgi:hypothetical protein
MRDYENSKIIHGEITACIRRPSYPLSPVALPGTIHIPLDPVSKRFIQRASFKVHTVL